MGENTCKKALLLFLIAFVFFCWGTTSIFASDGIRIIIPSSNKKSFSGVVENLDGANALANNLCLEFKSTVDAELLDDRFLSYDDERGLINFNVIGFENSTEKSKKKVLSSFINELQESNVSESTQQKIIDEMAAGSGDISRLISPIVMDHTTADVFKAMKWVNPILPIVRVVFGLGSIFITITLIASTILDLVFIGLPIGREFLHSKAETNGKGKPPFISSDAVSVINETESALNSSGGYKNPYIIYFKRRVITYIVLSICLLYLVIGELGGLISWLLSLGDGVVQ